MAVTTLSAEQLYSEISDLARDQGISSKEQWDEMVDDVVEDHLELGELDLDQDTEGMKEALAGKWANWKKESALTGENEDSYEEDTKMDEEVKENDDEEIGGLDDEEDEY